MSRIACLTLDYAGRPYRLASRTCDPVSDDGPLHYRGALASVDLDDGLALFQDSTSGSVDVEAIIPSLSSLVALGHDLHGCRAELAWWEEGQAWEDREIAVDGWVGDCDAGPDGAPARLTLSMDQGEDTAQWPPGMAVAGSDTLSALRAGATYPDGVDGMRYPWIFGWPGVCRLGSGTIAGVPATPAPVIMGDPTYGLLWALVAGHAPTLHPTAVAPRLRLHHLESGVSDYIDPTVAIQPLITTQDDLGQTITYARVSGAAGYAPAVWAAWAAQPVAQLAVSWYDDTATSPHGYGFGGLADRQREAPLTRAGDILRWALERTAITVDWSRTEAAIEHLRPYLLSGYWDQRCPVWQWVADNLLPILPVSMHRGPKGVYPVVWRWWAGREEARHHLEIGRNAAWISGPAWEGWEDTCDEVEVQFARSIRGEFKSSRTVGSSIPAARRRSASLTARLQALSHAPRTQVISSDMIWHEATAGLVAQWRMQAYGVPRQVMRVRIDPDRRVELGDIVELTYSSASMSRRVGMIRRIRRSATRTEIEILLHSPWLR